MLKKINNFLKSTSGSIMPTMGILAIPLTLAAGAAVDYSLYSNFRSKVQSSIDIASLATSHQLGPIFNSVPENLNDEQTKEYIKKELEDYANVFMKENMGNSSIGTYKIEAKYTTGSLTAAGSVSLTANIEYDTIFGSKNSPPPFFVDIINEDIISAVQIGDRTVELALVVDNSNSMKPPKLAELRKASTSLVNSIFGSASLSSREDPVQFSIVPFAGMVRLDPSNKNASWMDVNGVAPTHHDNFDWLNSYVGSPQPVRDGNGVKVDGKWKTRMDVFKMLGTSWAGCVEMRPWPHNVLDTVTSNSGTQSQIDRSVDIDGDGINDSGNLNALFVPFFAPDEPDEYYPDKNGNKKLNAVSNSIKHKRDKQRYGNNYLYDFKTPDNKIHQPTKTNYAPVKDAITINRQIERTNWMFKYQTNLKTGTINAKKTRGPNLHCAIQELTPLTTDRNLLLNKIDDLTKTSLNTNMHAGLTWGWRTLSESEPFTAGRPNGARQNLKFIVLLTDGANYYQKDRGQFESNSHQNTPNLTAYGPWGYARVEPENAPTSISMQNPVTGRTTHNRWSQGLARTDLTGTIYENTRFEAHPDQNNEFREIMDAHTLQACNNIRDDSITIYAVAFDVKNDNIRNLLTNCAGSGRLDGEDVVDGTTYYFEADNNQLTSTFEEIAAQISDLRLTQ